MADPQLCLTRPGKRPASPHDASEQMGHVMNDAIEVSQFAAVAAQTNSNIAPHPLAKRQKREPVDPNYIQEDAGQTSSTTNQNYTCHSATLISTKQCQYAGCTKIASFGQKHRKASFCAAHKLENHVDVRSSRCQQDGCSKQPVFGAPGGKAAFCGVHKAIDHVNVKKPRCEHAGCEKFPSYGPGGGKASWCADHKSREHVNVVKSRCQHTGCDTQARYGPEGGKSVYCAAHKEETHVNLKERRRCEHEGCTKTPRFGREGGQASFCLEHREDTHVDVRSCRCFHPGCLTLPCFGVAGGKALFCAMHKDATHVNVKRSSCEHAGCILTPSYGPEGDRAMFCANHKAIEHVDVRSSRCQYTGCNRRSLYGIKGGRPLFCINHRSSEHVDVNTICCQHAGCNTQARFGWLFDRVTRCFRHKTAGMFRNIHPTCPCGDKQPCFTDQDNNYPMRCEKCKTQQDLNVVERKCCTCGLMNLIREGLENCSDCQEFHVKQPHKQAEMVVKGILDEAQLPYKSHDAIPVASCHRYRPDFLFDWGTHIVILEVDEGQHKSYACECEQARMINLFQDQGGMKTLFIRYNPDNYRDCTGKLHKWTPARGTKLLEVIRQTRDHPPQHLLSAVYLYYDKFEANAIQFTQLNYGL